MVFSSVIFICFFLPVTLLVYHLLRGIRIRNLFLMVVSLFFYAYGEGIFVLLMIGSSLWNWLMALLIDRCRARAQHTGAKMALVLACGVDLGLLAVYKYAGMIVSTLNTIFRLSLPQPAIALPIGISFFTFQAMSYVADVYRGEVVREKNPLNVILYISFFPQLIAGPIVRYHDIAAEIRNRQTSLPETARGFRRFIFGLSKKVMIANTMGAVADQVFGLAPARLSLPLAWFGAIAYMLQIYFDFSGYSDMAIGLGRMFGFHFRENFNYPYAAPNMLDFWRKWHISLTDWFRENLYIPLGGNRRGKARTWRNRFLVFFCTGLWHGASWTFVLWGLYHGCLTVLEVAFPSMTKRMKGFSHVYTLLAVCIGFVLFRSESLAQFGTMMAAMFVPVPLDAARLASWLAPLNGWNAAMLGAGVLFSTPVLRMVQQRCAGGGRGSAAVRSLSYVMSLVLLFLCLCSLAGGSYNPFIYFRF